jgi:hypothetical protein
LPIKTLAKTIKERLKNVVSFCTHKITNAVAEGMNSKIMSIKRRVGGSITKFATLNTGPNGEPTTFHVAVK